MRTAKKVRPALILFVVLLSSTALADAAAAPGIAAGTAERPRVGLVLGGGGARGAAHIGVLKELEQMQVPIDAIAGTSMGAIVGGLYASGLDADELEEIVSTMDWAGALSDRPERSHLSFRRKQDDRLFPIKLEVGIKDGEVRLPQGVIQGQKLDLVLRDLTKHVAGVSDFDELPIPFRAVASDIVRGEAYVMAGGDLAQSIRASMSVPGAFAPVTIDDHLLVDGGLVGNLPVDVIRAMDVDVVIAVDVEFPLYGIEDLESVVKISEQMLTVLIRKETRRQIESLGDNDILIRPDLGTFASTDFGLIVETLLPGRAAAQAHAAELQKLSVDDATWQRYLARRSVGEHEAVPLEFVRIENDSRVSPALLETRMDLGPGDPSDPVLLAEEANRLYGLQVFEKVSYRVIEEDGRTGAVFDARSRQWGTSFMRFGLGIEDDFEGSTTFNVNGRLWTPAMNRLGGEWRTDLSLGTDPLLFTEFYQPLRSDARLFVSPKLALGQSNVRAFQFDDAIARLRLSEIELGLDVGAELGTWGELRAGVFRGRGEARVKVGDPAIPNLEFQTGGVSAGLRFDTLDSATFPRTGQQGELVWTMSRPGFGADDRYDTFGAEFASAWSRGKSTLILGLDYGTTVNSVNAVQDYFPLGGFLRLSGLERSQVAGPHAALARLIAYRRIGDSAGGLLEVPVYLGASLEKGNVWQSRDDIDFASMLTNGSLFLGLDSFIGPVFLAAGFSEGGRTNFYLFIGNSLR